jgi:GntP family gluconate:H+ symporter
MVLNPLPLLAAGAMSSSWPFFNLLICIALIIFLITVVRVHAFLALIAAAMTAGLLAAVGSLPGEPEKSHWVQAVELTTVEFGATAGKIGLVIALASIIGVCLMESGAADKIVRRFMSVLGERRAAVALLASGFFLSIPVFFDTVFFLLIPLARALALRTGRNYMLYVMAICGGGVITHSLVAPTPGPLIVAEIMKQDLGLSMVAGLLAGLPAAVGVYFVVRFLNARVNVPLRDTPGASLADLRDIVNRPDAELPSFLVSVLPVVLPVLLIALASFLGMAPRSFPSLIEGLGGPEPFTRLFRCIEFLGNKNVALLIGTLIAMAVLVRQRRLTFTRLGVMMGPPLETAAIIVLITSAGGAFGAMIKHAGVGEAIRALASGSGFNLILLAWLVTAVIRIAQGSATVAMITTAGMMASIIGDGTALGYHPLYIFLAIGFGSMTLSWMNDSGFWVVGKLSGFSEQETLKTWTTLVTALAVMGLIELMIASSLLPLPVGR